MAVEDKQRRWGDESRRDQAPTIKSDFLAERYDIYPTVLIAYYYALTVGLSISR